MSEETGFRDIYGQYNERDTLLKREQRRKRRRLVTEVRRGQGEVLESLAIFHLEMTIVALGKRKMSKNDST